MNPKILFLSLLALNSAPSLALSVADFDGEWVLARSGCVEPYKDEMNAGFFFESWSIAHSEFKHKIDVSAENKYPDCKNVFSSGAIDGTPEGTKLRLRITTKESKDCVRPEEDDDSTSPLEKFSDAAHGEEMKETFELHPDGERNLLFDENSADPNLANGCTRMRKVFVVKPDA